MASSKVSLGKLDSSLHGVALMGAYAGLFGTVFFLPGVWFTFAAGKAWVFQACVGLAFPSWLWLAKRQPAFRPAVSIWLLATGLMLLSMTLSLVFAASTHASFWGSTEKMDGLLTQLHLYGWLLMAVTLWRDVAHWQRAMRLMLFAGLLSAALALLQIPFPSILGPSADSRISGTTGNPVYLSALHLQWVFLSGLLWVSYHPLRAWALLLGASSVMVMVMTGARGAALGLLVGLVAAALFTTLSSRKNRFALGVGASFGVVAVVYLALRMYAWPHPALREFWTRNDNLSRLFVLSDFWVRLPSLTHALESIAGHRLFGWGVGNYDFVFSRFFQPKEACNERALNDAHNILAQVLTTQGVVGLSSWLLFFGVVVFLVIKQTRSKRLGPIEGGLALGWAVGAQVPNLFNPDSLAPSLSFLFLCALIFAQTQPYRPFLERRETGRFPLYASLAVGVAGVLWTSIFPAMASMHALRAVRSISEGRLASPWPELLAASKWPTPYLEEQLIAGSTHILRLSETGVLKKFPLWEQLLQLQDKWFEDYRKHNQRIRLWVMQANTMNQVAKATSSPNALGRAEALFQEARAMNPARQEVLFAYGQFLTEQRRLDEAEALFQEAIEVEPSYGQAHFRLGVFLWQQRGRSEEGTEAIVRSRRTSCLFWGEEVGEVAQLAQAFFVKGDGVGLKAMALRARDFRPTLNNIESYLQIAEFLTRAGFPSEARELLAEVERQLPGAIPPRSP